MRRINYARVQTASDDDDLVEFAAMALVFMQRNVSTAPGSFHDAKNPQLASTPGSVIASPSYPEIDPGNTDQDYVFHWIRDAAIAATELAASPTPDTNGVDPTLCDYVAFCELCQNNAVAANRFFLARFRVDGDPLTLYDNTTHTYTDYWSEQKDGPALRSLSFVNTWPYLDAASRATATRVAQQDLDETVTAWTDDTNKLGPWEDMIGRSFFARAAQIRFLKEVVDTNTLGLNVSADAQPALDGLSEALKGHWSEEKSCYISVPDGTPTAGTDASAYDPNADVIMAYVYGAIPCTDPKLLSTAAKLRAAFVEGHHEYPINADDHGRGFGPMVGRYPSDNYDGDIAQQPNEGQPWAICTANFAQLYYDVAKAFGANTGPAFDELTSAFYSQTGLTEATVSDPAQAGAVANALVGAGDKMLRAIMFHSDNGHLNEQFDKVTGYEKSVEDLTWSYAAFTSAVRARP